MNVTQPLQDLAVIQFQIKPELQAQEGTLMHTCFCGFIYNTIRTSKTSTPDRYEVILLICLDYMYMHIECTAYVLVLVIFVSLYYTHILTFSLFYFVPHSVCWCVNFPFPPLYFSLFPLLFFPSLSLSQGLIILRALVILQLQVVPSSHTLIRVGHQLKMRKSYSFS